MRMRVPGTDPGAAHMVMMPLLRRADGIVVPDDARAVFAELAVHRRIAGIAFVNAVEEGVDDPRVIAEIAGLDEGDLGETGGSLVGLAVDAFDQNPGEQEIRKDDDAAETEKRRTVERRVQLGGARRR